MAKTFGVTYTVTLIDDCSPNKDFIVDLEKHKLKKVPIQYLRHDKHQGFGAALKTGFDNTHNDWVLFLHADTRIEQTDWLINMLQSMHDWKDEGVKLVHAKVNDGGTGAYSEEVLGTTERRNDMIVEEPLPLICALVHRQLFDHIGGFVKPYQFGWYEDEETYWRMRIKNFKQMVCGEAFVYHHGGATIRELQRNYKIKQIMEGNKDTYIKDVQTFARNNKQ